MAEVRAELSQEGRTAELHQDGPLITLGEGRLGIKVWAPRDALISFDDEPLGEVWVGEEGLAIAQVDLKNQVGYHRLEVRRGATIVSFDFLTESAKASWEAVRTMALYVVGQVFGYRRQFIYSTVSGERGVIRSPEVDFAWLRERLPEVASLVTDIDRRPGRQPGRALVTSFRGGRLAIPQTARLLRENRHLLEHAPDGPIKVAERSYWPTAVKVTAPREELPALEHEQIASFLRTLTTSCEGLLGHPSPGLPKARVRSWSETLSGLRRLGVIEPHDRPGTRPSQSPIPTMLQRTDARYRRLRQLHSEHARDVVASAPAGDTVRTNVRYVWEIYQAFVAHMIGFAFGMRYPTDSADLRQRDRENRSMFSSRFDLYYDVRPPAHVLRSWRDSSSRPAQERPDIVVFDRKNRNVAVVDAKFKSGPQTGGANAQDLFEMQAYLQSFGLRRGGIVFPGEVVPGDPPEAVSAEENLLLGIPMLPHEEVNVLCTSVRDAIGELWQPAP